MNDKDMPKKNMQKQHKPMNTKDMDSIMEKHQSEMDNMMKKHKTKDMM